MEEQRILLTFTPNSSPNDDRKYLGVELNNSNFTALLISDPKIDKSAAALTVRVGSTSDYPDSIGLAHFCEHMILLGTNKYPIEGSYKAFIKGHSGTCNASTSTERTTFHFEIVNEFFDEALDRFGDFFSRGRPTFNESAVGREVNAVDSEHVKNLQNDPRRQYQLLRFTSNP